MATLTKPHFNLHRLKFLIRAWCPWLVPVHRWFFGLRTRGQSLEMIFSAIYRTKLWGAEQTLSGLGSRLEANETLIRMLPEVFDRYKIKTVYDAACGDFNWMKHVDLSSVDYLGADIVAPVVSENQVKHGSKNVNFRHLNLLESQLPVADLVVCKDLFIHFTCDQVKVAIRRLKASGSKYLLATTVTDRNFTNEDIPTGYFRRLSLLAAPFSFPAPLEVMATDKPEWGDPNALWELDKLPDF